VGGSYRFTLQLGKPKDSAGSKNGNKLARPNFGCLMPETPVSSDCIKAEGKPRRMGAGLMAVAAEGTPKAQLSCTDARARNCGNPSDAGRAARR